VQLAAAIGRAKRRGQPEGLSRPQEQMLGSLEQTLGSTDWTHEIRRNFFFESLVKERPSPRFALRGRRLEANRRNMRQRVAVCHIPQAQQQPISLKHKAPASHERARRVRAMAHRSGAIGGSGRADESRGGGTRHASVLVPLEPGRVVAASPLARQRHAGLGSGVLRTRLLAGGKQRLIDW